jgi:hypothetical protein
MKKIKLMVFAVAIFAATVFCGNVGTASAQNGSMEWRGTVDDVIQIRIRNRNAQTRHISGREYFDADFNFDGRAPRQNANLRVEKRDGRGRVFIVQQPNRRNNFTTLIQIVDSKGGADRYRFTLYWD